MRTITAVTLALVFGWLHGAVSCLAADDPAAETDQKQADVAKILAKEIVVPDGVVYKKATPEQNRKAIEKLTKTFLAADVKELPDDLLPLAMICGAGMWQNIKDDAEMKKIELGRTQIHVPTDKGMQQLEGKFFQNKEELAAFWRAFRRKYKLDTQATIRRPTANELSLYWAMIPFDITEPIFMIESKDGIILTHFMADKLTIAWIDDLKNMRFEQGK